LTIRIFSTIGRDHDCRERRRKQTPETHRMVTDAQGLENARAACGMALRASATIMITTTRMRDGNG
jgi:hypothetical protein